MESPCFAAPAGVVEGELSADDWPAGCCGYAVNLLRPARPGFRAQVLYPVIGTTLARALTLRAYKVECFGDNVQGPWAALPAVPAPLIHGALCNFSMCASWA